MDAPSSPLPPPHIVLCPWLAFGHMLPYLELAERLASRGHRVPYVSTPRNLARLPTLRRRHGVAAGAIDLVPLTVPRVEGLPDGAESTNDVPGGESLWEAFNAARRAVRGVPRRRVRRRRQRRQARLGPRRHVHPLGTPRHRRARGAARAVRVAHAHCGHDRLPRLLCE
ncbi:unnamed protein product [Urochloa humidicola]